jgi:hypothetical protein
MYSADVWPTVKLGTYHYAFFLKHSTNIDTHIGMSTSKILSQFDLEIYEVGHQDTLLLT